MITLRGFSRIALYLTFVFAFALPALPQGNEAKDWQAVLDQKDQKKKADGMEAFIKKYPTSTRRPAADGDLVDLWLKNNDTGKIVPFAEEYKKAPPSPDAAAKTKIYGQAALVAYTAGNIEKAAERNTTFRTVLYTAKNCQLVVMSLKPGEDIGAEVHKLDQFFRIEEGEGKAVLDGIEHRIKPGFAILVPAGTHHNIINGSSGSMKLYTLYAPPNHRDGVVHATKTDAEADKEHFEGTTTE